MCHISLSNQKIGGWLQPFFKGPCAVLILEKRKKNTNIVQNIVNTKKPNNNLKDFFCLHHFVVLFFSFGLIFDDASLDHKDISRHIIVALLHPLLSPLVSKWLKLSFAADDPIGQEDACPEDSNCPSECYCEGGTVDCSHRELKGNTINDMTIIISQLALVQFFN